MTPQNESYYKVQMQAFYEDWAHHVRQGARSPLTGTECAVLELFVRWLEKAGQRRGNDER